MARGESTSFQSDMWLSGSQACCLLSALKGAGEGVMVRPYTR